MELRNGTCDCVMRNGRSEEKVKLRKSEVEKGWELGKEGWSVRWLCVDDKELCVASRVRGQGHYEGVEQYDGVCVW